MHAPILQVQMQWVIYETVILFETHGEITIQMRVRCVVCGVCVV